jgi:hypothetical protein
MPLRNVKAYLFTLMSSISGSSEIASAFKLPLLVQRLYLPAVFTEGASGFALLLLSTAPPLSGFASAFKKRHHTLHLMTCGAAGSS